MTNEILKSLLSDDIICGILKEIATRKNATYKEIRNKFPNSNTGSLTQKLDILKNAGLLGVVSSQYRDFDSYYLTSDGLKMFRLLALTFAAGR